MSALALPPVDNALELAWRIVAVLPPARTLADLDPIELPEAGIREDDVAHLVTLGPLYLASELETAHVVDAAEALAGVAMTGGLNVDLGAAADALATYWHRRHERFAPTERHALFGRLFDAPLSGPPLATHGPGGLAPFDAVLAGLVQALLEPSAQATQRVSIAGRQAIAVLVDELLRRSGGVPAQLARDL